MSLAAGLLLPAVFMAAAQEPPTPAQSASGARAAAPAAGPAGSDFGLINARHPEEGVLFSGQPDAGQLEALGRAGFATVIDLRSEGEERGYDEVGLAQSLGITYQSLPITSATLQSPATYSAFFEAFGKAERPVLVHCASGNRVGALYYAYLVAVRGMERSDALAEARKQGLHSGALIEVIDAFLDR